MTDPAENMEAAPGMGSQGPIQQDATGAVEQVNNIESAVDGLTDRLCTPADMKDLIRKFAVDAREAGQAKHIARTGFRDRHEADVTITSAAIDLIFDQVFAQPRESAQGDDEFEIDAKLHTLRISAAARERLEIEQRGRPDGIDVLSAEELLNMPPPAWLIDGLFPATGTFQMYGDSNTGKSFLVLDLLLATASGERWLGYFDVTKPGPVVYVAAEGGFDVGDRIRGWSAMHGGVMPSDFHAVIEQGLDLRYRLDVDQLMERLSGYEPIAVVFDTWALHMPGGDENSAKDAGQVVAALKRMATDLEALVGTVHHTGKDADRGARGSSAMRAAWDAEFHFTGTQLIHTKARYGPKHDVIGVEMQPVDLGDGRSTLVPTRVEAIAAAAAAGMDIQRQVLDAIRAMEGQKWTPIRDSIPVHNNKSKAARDELLAAGRIEDRAGRWFVVGG